MVLVLDAKVEGNAEVHRPTLLSKVEACWGGQEAPLEVAKVMSEDRGQAAPVAQDVEIPMAMAVNQVERRHG